jgi:hypothetical protein
VPLVTDYAFCVELTVPDNIDLEEPRDLPASTDHLGNPILSALRVDLRMDGRWKLQRVSSTSPEFNRNHQQHLLVWVTASGPTLDGARRKVQAGVHDVVNGVTTATLLEIRDEP